MLRVDQSRYFGPGVRRGESCRKVAWPHPLGTPRVFVVIALLWRWMHAVVDRCLPILTRGDAVWSSGDGMIAAWSRPWGDTSASVRRMQERDERRTFLEIQVSVRLGGD